MQIVSHGLLRALVTLEAGRCAEMEAEIEETEEA
jgi:hypothetical protein